jgi:hypothetical protein
MMREGSRGTDPLIPKHNYTNKWNIDKKQYEVRLSAISTSSEFYEVTLLPFYANGDKMLMLVNSRNVKHSE